jgi:pimeloyl-ACP methyl ester carboxylesterase
MHSIELADGRRLDVDDGDSSGSTEELTVIWFHGSPHTGKLIDPVRDLAETRRIRLVAFARPSYGGSTPNPGRDIASVARDTEAVANNLGIGQFAAVGYSGGGPGALACAALLSDRVIAAACLASPAPFTTEFDWFAGMAAPAALLAAQQGRAFRARHAETEEFDENSFTPADWAALSDRWAAVGRDAVEAEQAGPDGLIDDDVALAKSWGFDPGSITVPVLLIHGTDDRVVPATHGDYLAKLMPSAELWRRPGDGHVSVLDGLPPAMDWFLEAAARM